MSVSLYLDILQKQLIRLVRCLKVLSRWYHSLRSHLVRQRLHLQHLFSMVEDWFSL